MFKYYNYKLIESNRFYSTEKIKKLIGIHEQTIREWINQNNLECVSRKPILIYGAVLKEFIKNRNENHKKTLEFNQMKCLKCNSNIYSARQIKFQYITIKMEALEQLEFVKIVIMNLANYLRKIQSTN